MADTTLVPNTSTNVNPETNFASGSTGNIKESQGKSTSTTKSEVWSLADFGGHDIPKGISEHTAKIMSDSRTEGTKNAYKSSWKRWRGWCSKREVDPIRCLVEEILEFLTDCYNEKQEYRTINKYRSAISALHEPVDGYSVGQHSLICRLMKGISNNRIPKPRLLFVWDVQQVIDHIASMGENKTLCDKELTHKCVALIAICLVSRGS